MAPSEFRVNRRKLLQLSGIALASHTLSSCDNDNRERESQAEAMLNEPGWKPIDFADHLDEELKKVYNGLPVDFLDFNTKSLAEIRALYSVPSFPPLPGVIIENIEITGDDGALIPLRLYKPESLPENSPAIYTIHAGGMVLGTVSQEDMRNMNLALNLNALVVSPAYRLAPEYPYPTPLDDCYSGLVWLSQSAAELGIDPTRIAVAGQSAGGGLAAGIALLARDLGGPQICCQHLIYPMLDDRNISPSSYINANSKIWSHESNHFGWNAYLNNKAGAEDTPYYAAPLRADSFSDLPPAYIAVGTLDVFMDESIDYARALTRAGIATELHVYPGAFHAFDLFAPKSSLALRWSAEELVSLSKRLA